MKMHTKVAFVLVGLGVIISVGAVAAAAPQSLPSEQQALVNAGYAKTVSWAKFDKQDGACHITVELSGKNYYVFTTGKLHATLYPVVPNQVVAGAALLDANCQG